MKIIFEILEDLHVKNILYKKKKTKKNGQPNLINQLKV